MTEYRPEIGNKREITKDEGVEHLKELAESDELRR